MMKHRWVALFTTIGMLAIGSPARSQEIRVDLTALINNIFNPSYKEAEAKAQAEIEKERVRQQAEIEKVRLATEAAQNTDRISPVLAQWGVQRTTCAPGVVFINGLTDNAVCIAPTDKLVAGYYNYSDQRQQLVRIDRQSTTNNVAQSAATGERRRNGGF